MATANDNSIETPASDAAKERTAPTFTLLIDPPDCDWEHTSTGLLYALQSAGRLLQSLDLYDVNEDRLPLVAQVVTPVLVLSTGILLERIAGHSVPMHERIEEALAVSGET